jgi:uncharacterized protein YbcI
MGRGPNDIRAHRIGDLVVVRLHGVLTAAEQHLVTTLPSEKGSDLLKQVRTQLIEASRSVLEKLVLEVTSTAVRNLHHRCTPRARAMAPIPKLQHPTVTSLRPCDILACFRANL